MFCSKISFLYNRITYPLKLAFRGFFVCFGGRLPLFRASYAQVHSSHAFASIVQRTKKDHIPHQLMHTVVFSSQYHRISCSPLEVLLDLHNYTGLGAILRPFFLLCDICHVACSISVTENSDEALLKYLKSSIHVST